MEKINNRNLEKLKPLDSYDIHQHILEADSKQIKLTNKWILPYSDLIISDFEKIREKIDRKLKKDPEHRATLKRKDYKYPVGLCKYLVDEVLKEIFGSSGYDKDMQGMKALKNFMREGGAVNWVWGVDKDSYFQNAIQIGSTIFDVANDTVDHLKPKVVFYPDYKEAPIKNVESIEKMADIAEKYWDYDVYPNIYFPNLAQILPALYIKEVTDKFGKKNKGLFFFTDTSHYFFFDNLYAVDIFIDQDSGEKYFIPFKASHDFIFNSKYSNKKLPKEFENLLHRAKDRNQNIYSTSHMAMSTDDIEAEFKSYVMTKDDAGEKIREIINKTLNKMERLDRFSYRPFLKIRS